MLATRWIQDLFRPLSEEDKLPSLDDGVHDIIIFQEEDENADSLSNMKAEMEMLELFYESCQAKKPHVVGETEASPATDRSYVTAPSPTASTYKEKYLNSMHQSIRFLMSLPPYASIKSTRPPLALGPKSTKMPPLSLVLELDAIFSFTRKDPEFCFPIVHRGITYQAKVNLRPHLFTFLEKLKDKFEIIVFTEHHKGFADKLLTLIDPEGKYFHHRVFRESCHLVEGQYVKDLTVLQRDLSKTVLLDNWPHTFGYHHDGILITSWMGNLNDTDLLDFSNTFLEIHHLRTTDRDGFQICSHVDEAKITTHLTNHK